MLTRSQSRTVILLFSRLLTNDLSPRSTEANVAPLTGNMLAAIRQFNFFEELLGKTWFFQYCLALNHFHKLPFNIISISTWVFRSIEQCAERFVPYLTVELNDAA